MPDSEDGSDTVVDSIGISFKDVTITPEMVHTVIKMYKFALEVNFTL